MKAALGEQHSAPREAKAMYPSYWMRRFN